jgi:2,4-dienoyl-CoA reductase-like NADH-dependent reductase (Old Yellow Enzyme family)
MSMNDPLLQPFRIKTLVLRNRIMSTSHASTLDDGGIPKDRYQRYHEEKAKGGIALTMFGGSSMVSKDSSRGGGQIDLADDAIIPWLRQFSERIHGHGAAIMCQISHLGRRAMRPGGTGCRPWAPPPSARRGIATFPARWTGTISNASCASTRRRRSGARRAGSTAWRLSPAGI